MFSAGNPRKECEVWWCSPTGGNDPSLLNQKENFGHCSFPSVETVGTVEQNSLLGAVSSVWCFGGSFGTLPNQCPLIRATGYSFLYREDVEGEVLSKGMGLEDNL